MSKKLKNQFLCSSLMLPEHRAKLAEHCQKFSTAEKYRRPPLDDQRQEEFQLLLERSLRAGLELQITTLTSKGRLQFTGVIKEINTTNSCLKLDTADGSLKLKSQKIIDIREASGSNF